MLLWLGAGLVALAAGGGWAVLVFSDPFRGLERVDLRAYADSAKSFQGGTYLVEGIVDDQLGSHPGKGRLIGLRAQTSQGAMFIPVLFPASLGSFNLQKGQALIMRAHGDGQGLLLVEKVKKR